MRPQNFLATPLWQRFQRRTAANLQFAWRVIQRNPVTRRGLKIAIFVLVLYLIVVTLAGVAIYRGKSNSVIRAVEKIFPYPAARVDGELIWLSRYNLEMNARTTYATKHNLTTTPSETAHFVMDQLVNRSLYRQAMARNKIQLDSAGIDARLFEIYNQVGGQKKLSEFLAQNYGSQVDTAVFRTWLEEAALETTIQNTLLEHATVRHILIAAAEGSSETKIEAARQKALTIKASLTDPAQFAEVAKNQSEDIASRDSGGSFGTTARGDTTPVLSADFEAAIFSIPVGQVSDPVRTAYGWHLIIVDERSGSIPLSKAAYTEQLRQERGVHIYLPLP